MKKELASGVVAAFVCEPTHRCRHEKTSWIMRFVVWTLTGSLTYRGISLYGGMCNLPQLHSLCIECAICRNSVLLCLDLSLHGWNRRPPKTHVYLVNCRCSRVICSYFFDGTVNGVSLLEILRNFIIPELTVSGIMEQVLFQQDGAAVHFIRTVREFLNGAFPFRWIGCVFQHPPCNYNGLHPVLTWQHLVTAFKEVKWHKAAASRFILNAESRVNISDTSTFLTPE